jgi:hypothetical protein
MRSGSGSSRGSANAVVTPNNSLDRSAISRLFIRKTRMTGSLSPRPVNCYVNVKPLTKEKCFFFLLLSFGLWFFLIISSSSRGCGNGGKLGAILAQSFPWLPQPGCLGGWFGSRALFFP